MSKTHNKLRNSGLIFELLGKAVVHEAIHRERSNALGIVKRHFKVGSELLKELNLYKILGQRTENNPVELIELTKRAWSSLDHEKLKTEKYNLIKDIKRFYNLNEFFKPRTEQYKLFGSIYKLFETNSETLDPDGYLTARNYITEHIRGKSGNVESNDENIVLWENEDKTVRKIGFKLLIKKFNDKYQTLGERQKNIISRYITEDLTSDRFKNFIVNELAFIERELIQRLTTINDTELRWQINESAKLLPNIAKARILKDDHLSAILKFHDLLEELK
jgi:hypothetical protein